jgi:hypothetical protein
MARSCRLFLPDLQGRIIGHAAAPPASAHFSCRLHRADDTLHVADGVDGRAHEARLPLWLPPTASAAPRRLAFHSLPFYVGGIFSRRPPLCVYCDCITMLPLLVRVVVNRSVLMRSLSHFVAMLSVGVFALSDCAIAQSLASLQTVEVGNPNNVAETPNRNGAVWERKISRP